MNNPSDIRTRSRLTMFLMYVFAFLCIFQIHLAAQQAKTGPQENRAKTPSEIYNLLLKDEAYPESHEDLTMYDPLIGSWDLDGTWYDTSGTSRKGKGEWYFVRIVGGRCIQDVLSAVGAHAYEVGTTLRCYDKSINAWRVSWMQPASGEFVNYIGRKVGENIVHEGVVTNPPGRIRWTFKDITTDSFVWLGEFSSDDGATWFLQQKMHGHRKLLTQ
ncbi:MAG: hypothetical protein HY089_03725 [Ignavibacteriales bacterium]|nr:hypothetical protein [Ignavibacteriales bacterium]